MFTPVFKSVMGSELIRQAHPAMLSFACTGPVSMLRRPCGREPKKTVEAKDV